MTNDTTRTQLYVTRLTGLTGTGRNSEQCHHSAALGPSSSRAARSARPARPLPTSEYMYMLQHAAHALRDGHLTAAGSLWPAARHVEPAPAGAPPNASPHNPKYLESATPE